MREFPADGMRNSALGELMGRKFDAATETRFSGCRNLKLDDRYRQSVRTACALKKKNSRLEKKGLRIFHRFSRLQLGRVFSCLKTQRLLSCVNFCNREKH